MVRRYDVALDPESQAIVTLGSKKVAHLAQRFWPRGFSLGAEPFVSGAPLRICDCRRMFGMSD